METMQSLKEHRIQNLVNAISFRKPKKIPTGAETPFRCRSEPVTYWKMKHTKLIL